MPDRIRMHFGGGGSKVVCSAMLSVNASPISAFVKVKGILPVRD